MAYKFSELTAVTSPATGDLVAIVDISDVSMAVSGTTKKITYANFAGGILAEIGITSSVAELNYTDGVTSAIQTQINNHLADTSTHGVATIADAADLTTHIADTTTHGTTGAITGISDTQTLTNKRITKRVVGTTSSATPTPNADTTDIYTLTALAEAAEFGAPSGTPTNGQTLIIRIKPDATPRALTWNAAYVAGGTALPTTTTASKITTVGLIYNTDNALNKWMCVAVATES